MFLLLQCRCRDGFCPLDYVYPMFMSTLVPRGGSIGCHIPRKRATSFSRSAITSLDAEISWLRRFFSFSAKAMYVERILEPCNDHEHSRMTHYMQRGIQSCATCSPPLLAPGRPRRPPYTRSGTHPLARRNRRNTRVLDDNQRQ